MNAEVNPIERMLFGVVAGTTATFPMTAVMQATRQLSRHEAARPLPPQQITHRAAEDAGFPNNANDDAVVFATIAGHFFYGAVCGAMYGVMAPKRQPILSGAIFGTAVWAGSYIGWLPRTGWHNSPQRETVARNFSLIASHVVWGAAAGLCFHALRNRQVRS